MVSLLTAQVNLAFQTAVFLSLVAGLLLIRRRKIKAHAQVMLAAVVLNIVSFMAIMAPALQSIHMDDSSTSALLAMVHGSIGAVALLLSIWVVGVWLMSPLMVVPAKMRCYGSLNKKLMVVVLSLWFASLILGFLLYAVLYV